MCDYHNDTAVFGAGLRASTATSSGILAEAVEELQAANAKLEVDKTRLQLEVVRLTCRAAAVVHSISSPDTHGWKPQLNGVAFHSNCIGRASPIRPGVLGGEGGVTHSGDVWCKCVWHRGT